MAEFKHKRYNLFWAKFEFQQTKSKFGVSLNNSKLESYNAVERTIFRYAYI